MIGTEGTALSHPGSILILGPAKGGTTALFYAIRTALTGQLGLKVEGLFEPSKLSEIADYMRDSPDQVHLVKGLLGPLLRVRGRHPGMFQKFERRITIFRDPRDNIVSRLVFMLPNLFHPREREKISQVIELFRRKEQNPEAISIMAIVRKLSELSGQEGLAEKLRDNSLLSAMIKREHGDKYFMMPYEDMVEGQFGALGEYLGFPVTGEFEVDKKHGYVVRRKAAKDWVNWFLDEDIEFFVKPVADDFRLLGFDPDERPTGTREIAPAVCSQYVTAQFERTRVKRQQQRAAKRERAAKEAGVSNAA